MLLVAQVGGVGEELGVEVRQDPLEEGDPALGRGDLVADGDRLRVDLGQLVLVVLDLGLEVAQGVRVGRGRQQREEDAGEGGQ